jgi:Ca2+-transporting ATPase
VQRSRESLRWPGLSAEAAAARLRAEGPNLLPQERSHSLAARLARSIGEPMVLLLVGASALYGVLGDLGEALILASSVVMVVSISLIQETRTERALAALRELSSPRAQVLRGGVVRTLPASELVRGDVVRVAEGDRVPADALLREGTALAVDESLLTGESVSVHKLPDPALASLQRPGGDTASLFAGTLVVSGRGVAEVIATGAHTELGKIGASLGDIRPEPTPLQREVRRVVWRVALAAVGLSLVLVVERGLAEGDWLRGALSGITLAMALLPEEFPIVMTVFLALGAVRISRERVLARRSSAIETLGAVQVLCVDKTGTLTENRMTIGRLRTDAAEVEVTRETVELPESVHELVEFGILACPRDPFDPMEQAFHEIGGRTLPATEHLHPSWQAVHEYPLTPELLAVTHVWRSPERHALVVATKGAPEAIFDLCHLLPAELAKWQDRAGAMAREGLRVLGVARGHGPVEAVPGQAHDLTFEIAGLVGLRDPLREGVVEALALCRDARIRVLMITGDHPDTARSVARAAGLEMDALLTGAELESLGEQELGERLLHTDVVARAVPADKLRIVRALSARGLVVGMTGDGVNDAPALKAAQIGIAMGARGTDVAREAAGLVLVDDDFGSIVHAVRLGRRIYDNLRRAFAYLVAVHFPITGLSLVPAFLGWPAVIGPIHVVFLELLIDPTCSVVFEMEPADAGVMRRPPRASDSRLLGARRLLWSAAQGTAAFGGALWCLWLARAAGATVPQLSALAFVSLVVGNLGLLLTTRDFAAPWWVTARRWNPAVPALLAGAAALLVLVLGSASLRALFDFAAPAPVDLARALAGGLLPVLCLDVLKAFRTLGGAR